MTDDIVERLRWFAYGTETAAGEAAMREAADEIERERKAHLELAASHHDATEEIARLREQRDKWCKAYEGAANENSKLQKALELQKQASRDVAATYNEQETEIERLEHMQVNLHGHIKRLEDEIAKLNQHIMSGDAAWAQTLQQLKDCRAENAKLREALEKTRAAIIQSAADTLWVGDIETAVDCIDAALNGGTK